MDLNQQYSPAYLAEDRGRELIDIVIAFAVLETFFIILFFTSRIMNHTANGWDVYLMIPGYLFCSGHIVLATGKPMASSTKAMKKEHENACDRVDGALIGPLAVMVRYCGTGRHAVALEPAVVIRWLKLDVVEVFMYLVSITLPKLAILFFYGRIFTTRLYRYAIYTTGSLIILTFLAGVITSIAICRPFSYLWDQSIPDGHCGHVIVLYRFISIPNLFTDGCIIVLPLHGVWGLQAKVIHKIGITVTFLTGCLGIVTGILRLVYFFQVDMFADVTWYSVSTMTWTLAEPGVYLIAATLPSLRPLVRYVFKDVKLDTLYSSLLDRWSRAFSRRKPGEVSTADILLNPAIGGKTTITAGVGVRFAGSVKIHDLEVQSKRLSDDEMS